MHGLLRGVLLAASFLTFSGATSAPPHGAKPVPHAPGHTAPAPTSRLTVGGARSFHEARLSSIAAQVFRLRRYFPAIENQANSVGIDAPVTDPSGPPGDVFLNDRQATRSIAAAPLSEAVSQVCGATATVCAVWWPGAVGDTAGYRECLLHSERSGSEPDFGETPAESCSAQFTGDCDLGAATSEDTKDLCNLVKGMGVQWAPEYRFGSFATSGDCAHFETIDQHDKNLIGLRLKDEPYGKPTTSASGTPTVSICAGTLFLLGAG